MNAHFRQWLNVYQYLAGLCDTGTGMLLIAFPGFILGLMGLGIVPNPYIRFIGVFVLSVGLTYLWTVIRWPLNQRSIHVWLTQWKITVLIRSLVAIFVVWQVAARAIDLSWITVAITDGIFAAIQIIGLEQGWIERAA